ncbi:MAG TPA: glycosyltransferase family 2 protein [Chthoniobacterales bacterium]|nr:glycosyltransferase family 2 protein [Chthoniobacterales bacterium]
MLSVIIPIYNECETIRLLFDKTAEVLRKIGQPWEIIFINDGSQDGSEETLDELANEHTEVKVLHFRRNFGQTAAMMAGFDYAQGEIIIPMDGDYQNDPEDIPKLLAKLDEGYDVVSGWRRDRQDNAIKRNLPSIMANKLIATVSGVRLQDFGCSLKAYRREVIEGVRLYGEMHRFLPVYTLWHGAKITEVVVGHFARRAGKSKYGLERILKVLLDLMVVKFLDRHAQKPMYVFGICGFLMIAAAGLFALWAILLYFFAGKPFISTPLPVLTVSTFMTGVICVLMGLLAEMITRTFYESQGKRIYLVRESRNIDTQPRS